MDGSQLASIALIITAVGGLVVAISTAYITVRGALRAEGSSTRIESKLDEVHEGVRVVAEEVHTSNSLKLGEMGDATETRRIEKIPVEERTDAEAEHIKDVPKTD